MMNDEVSHCNDRLQIMLWNLGRYVLGMRYQVTVTLYFVITLEVRRRQASSPSWSGRRASQRRSRSGASRRSGQYIPTTQPPNQSGLQTAGWHRVNLTPGILPPHPRNFGFMSPQNFSFPNFQILWLSGESEILKTAKFDSFVYW